ncbi:hypothetical protein [Lignipirellula cremea]|uniref:Uncharacterized protein n=1 Tax=Lignipirellula cremea TaxID=2528010 RepID=A0A518DQJ3_9BACT|nr:hypothetical protein [Lignipirellula cremea]QDU94108.1 hypothetical protein Pla8534_18940 [Lignipirellula cremea]
MENKPLSQLVRIYNRKHGSRLAAYLDYFQTLDSIEDAIRFACHGKEDKIHGHQHLVGKAKLEQARKKLQKCSDGIATIESFGDLLGLVEDRTSSIDRFGVLAIYDTALRLGSHLDVWPEVVYLHAGTKKGCKALGVAAKGGTVEMEQLPKPIRSLEPYQAEDFLCIFKYQFDGEGGKMKGCLP